MQLLQVDERSWKVRLLVQAPHTEEQYTYEWTMVSFTIVCGLMLRASGSQGQGFSAHVSVSSN